MIDQDYRRFFFKSLTLLQLRHVFVVVGKILIKMNACDLVLAFEDKTVTLSKMFGNI